MKAVFIEKYGRPEVLIYGDLPKPVIDNDELLIKVFATSVNPVDWKLRKGMLRFLPGQKLPKILGGDISGIVEEAGKDVMEFKPGDEIYGLISAVKGGGYAEYATAKPHQVSLKPKNINFEEAATIPLAALTAYQSIKRLGKLKVGDKILVNGCSGGVGHFAVQIAKAMGANVIGVCSTKNIELVKILGAEKIIDYTSENIFSDNITYDIFFDAVANQSFWKARKYLNKNGRYVTTLPSVGLVLNLFLNIFSSKKGKMISVKSFPEDLRFLSELIKSDKLRTVIDTAYKLKDIKEAHIHSETDRVVGKLAISIN
ncbi:NAD(P)-dependent alcohol dehydrogenase [Candidatus Neomarinimicrobiota bacterium]